MAEARKKTQRVGGWELKGEKDRKEELKLQRERERERDYERKGERLGDKIKME